MIRRSMISMTRRGRSLLAALLLLALTVAAQAQNAADAAAPQPTLQKSPPVWLGLFVMFVMLAMVITVSLMPSKRGHQN